MIFGFERKRTVRHGVNNRRETIRRTPFTKRRTLGEGVISGKAVVAKKYSFEKRKSLPSIELAVKRCKNPEYARRAYEAYRGCREAGLPVPVTFGIDEKNPRFVYLTDLSMGGEFAVESASNKTFSKSKITGITNIPELARTMAWASVLADAARIDLKFDCVFFRFPSEGGEVSVDIAVADYDLISLSNTKEERTPILDYTKTIASVFVNATRLWLIKHNVQSQLPLSIAEALQDEIDKVLPEYVSHFQRIRSAEMLKRYHHNGVLYTKPDETNMVQDTFKNSEK